LSTINKNNLENKIMRIDKFLNSVNITKRRSVAQDMINNKVVLINGVVAKASKNVDIGTIITINYLENSKKYEVLQIPTTKSTPKSLQGDYIKEV
jgi:ribosomal 50S subunit-recycling heat shock protein